MDKKKRKKLTKKYNNNKTKTLREIKRKIKAKYMYNKGIYRTLHKDTHKKRFSRKIEPNTLVDRDGK